MTQGFVCGSLETMTEYLCRHNAHFSAVILCSGALHTRPLPTRCMRELRGLWPSAFCINFFFCSEKTYVSPFTPQPSILLDLCCKIGRQGGKLGRRSSDRMGFRDLNLGRHLGAHCESEGSPCAYIHRPTIPGSPP